jgi:hypothetical protein
VNVQYAVSRISHCRKCVPPRRSYFFVIRSVSACFLSLEMHTLMNNDSTLSTATSRRNGRPENLVSNSDRGRDVTFSIMFTSAVGPTWLSHSVSIRGFLSSSKMAGT